jgi:hypothetical protein
MTIPHMSNCSHSPDSWCLSCVAAQLAASLEQGIREGLEMAAKACSSNIQTEWDNARDCYEDIRQLIAERKKT